MKFTGYIATNYQAAGSKGTIYAPDSTTSHYIVRFEIEATDEQQALERLQASFMPGDPRPLGGKSYIRKCQTETAKEPPMMLLLDFGPPCKDCDKSVDRKTSDGEWGQRCFSCHQIWLRYC